MARKERRWLVGPGEAHIDIAVGREARLSPELLEALRNVARVLQGEGDQSSLRSMECPQITIENCEILVSCRGITMN